MRGGVEVKPILWCVAMLPAVATAQSAAACLSALHGVWVGTGRVAGREVVMQQAWRPALGGTFSELVMTHRLPSDTARVVFEGRGFYRVSGDSVTGTWMDARGLTMALRGTCRANTLAMEWTGAERGATAYTRHADSTLEVADSVDTASGRREFGRSRLRVTATAPGR